MQGLGASRLYSEMKMWLYPYVFKAAQKCIIDAFSSKLEMRNRMLLVSLSKNPKGPQN